MDCLVYLLTVKRVLSVLLLFQILILLSENFQNLYIKIGQPGHCFLKSPNSPHLQMDFKPLRGLLIKEYFGFTFMVLVQMVRIFYFIYSMRFSLSSPEREQNSKCPEESFII